MVALGTDRLRYHVGAEAADIISGARSRSNTGLRSVRARDWMAWMRREGNTVGNGRRSRRSMVTDLLDVGRLELGRHHVVHAVLGPGRGAIAIFLVFFVVAAVEIGWAFVLIWYAVLWSTSVSAYPLTAKKRATAQARVGRTHVLVSGDEIAHVRGRILVELLVGAEDEDGDIGGAENGQLVSLLEETELALEEGAAKGRVSSEQQGER